MHVPLDDCFLSFFWSLLRPDLIHLETNYQSVRGQAVLKGTLTFMMPHLRLCFEVQSKPSPSSSCLVQMSRAYTSSKMETYLSSMGKHVQN